jgi:hypothetical protein
MGLLYLKLTGDATSAHYSLAAVDAFPIDTSHFKPRLRGQLVEQLFTVVPSLL